ncbi:hypothetical protein [Streptomyces sp. NBC_00645]|uniref:hypothetical protein n=1 Tax=Streptomyces sp. NBC_00645 TaxID=2975795 RepID=UPI00324A36FF
MPDPLRVQAAGVLAEHTHQIGAAIRAHAETVLPEDAPGMERAAELLGLHKTRLLTAEHGGALEPLLSTLTSAFTALVAVEAAHAVARRWAVLRTHGSAATELRDALAGPSAMLPTGFARHSSISVSCVCCEYKHDEDESYTVYFDTLEEATKTVVDAGWTVFEDGSVLCHSDDAEHQELRTPQQPEQVPVCEGQEELTAAVNCALESRSR